MKYFYIIQRNGLIHEVENIDDRFMKVIDELAKGGIIVIRKKGHDEPCVVNSVDVSNVLNAKDYNTYIDTVNPKRYIKNGTWYDSKERKVLRHEDWKDTQIKIGEAKTKEIEAPKDSEKVKNKLKETREALMSKKVIN